MTRYQKLLLVTGLLVGILVAVKMYEFIVYQGPAQTILRYRQTEEALMKAIQQLYYEDGAFPRTDILQTDLDRIRERLANYNEKVGENNPVQSAFQTYLQKVDAQKVVNQLYQRPLIVEGQVQSSSPLAENLDYLKVKEWFQRYYDSNTQDSFKVEINRGLDYAKKEQDTLRQAYQEISDLEFLPKEPQYSRVIALAVNDIVAVESQIHELAYLQRYKQDAEKVLNAIIPTLNKWDAEAKEVLRTQSAYLAEHIQE